jgi:hypothetical protein
MASGNPGAVHFDVRCRFVRDLDGHVRKAAAALKDPLECFPKHGGLHGCEILGLAASLGFPIRTKRRSMFGEERAAEVIG